MVHMQDRGSDRAGQGAQQRDPQDGSFWQQLSTLGTDLFGSGSLSPTHHHQPSSSPLLASKGALPETASMSDRQKEPLRAAAPPGQDLLSEACALPISAQQVEQQYPPLISVPYYDFQGRTPHLFDTRRYHVRLNIAFLF